MERTFAEMSTSFIGGGEGCHFNHIRIKTGAKRRIVAVPNLAMRKMHDKIQARILYALKDKEEFLQSAHGSIPGRSALTNAYAHKDSRFFYKLDIEDAYPSTWGTRLAYVLHNLDEQLGDPQEIYSFIRRFCMGKKGGLLVGAPASPLLFNIFCASEIDPYIRDLFVGFTTYTRYLDDLTISSPSKLPRAVRRRAREIVEDANFSINPKKTSILDIELGSVTVTGVALTRSGQFRPTESFISSLTELLYTPVSSMTEHSARKFHGQVSHLLSFPKHLVRKREWVTCETISLERRCLRKIRKLIRAGKLPKTAPQRVIPSNSTGDRTLVDSVKNNVPIEKVLGNYVDLRRVGGSAFLGKCPFHTENTESFRVTPHKGIYHCFGCGATGDVIRFLMEMEDIPFQTALRRLAKEYDLLGPNRPRKN